MPEQLVRDFRFALRGLRREPTFALTAIVALAIGVATVTTTFSVADAELWKPLPYPHPEQLVAIYSRGPGARAQTDPIAGADLVDWRAGAPAFSDVAATGRTLRRVLRLDTAESVVINEVTANYFATLGRQPIVGRTFGPDDARKSQAALLTDRAWRRLFAADASVVGRQLFLDDDPIVIAGIVAADDSLGPDGDLYLPIDESTAAFLDRTIAMGYGAIGRLQPGADAKRRERTAPGDGRSHRAGASRGPHGTHDLRGGSGRAVLGLQLAAAVLLPRRGDRRAAPECRQRRDAAPRTRGPADARVRAAGRPRWRSRRARAPAVRRRRGHRHSGRRARDAGLGVGAEAVHGGAALGLPRPRVRDPDRRPRHALHARRVGNDDDRVRDGAAAVRAADRSHAGAWRGRTHRRIGRRGPHPQGAARGAAGAHRRAALWRRASSSRASSRSPTCRSASIR